MCALEAEKKAEFPLFEATINGHLLSGALRDSGSNINIVRPEYVTPLQLSNSVSKSCKLADGSTISAREVEIDIECQYFNRRSKTFHLPHV